MPDLKSTGSSFYLFVPVRHNSLILTVLEVFKFALETGDYAELKQLQKVIKAETSLLFSRFISHDDEGGLLFLKTERANIWKQRAALTPI